MSFIFMSNGLNKRKPFYLSVLAIKYTSAPPNLIIISISKLKKRVLPAPKVGDNGGK
jgi:hypothetical protein